MLYLKLFAESVRFALASLANNKLRTSLSLLGVTIGIFAIISVFTMVDSMENKIRDSINSLGDNVVFVQKWPWEFGKDYAWWKYMQRPVPDLQELEQIRRNKEKIAAAAFISSVSRNVSTPKNVIGNTEIIAASHDYDKVQSAEIDQGRYFAEIESEAGRPVAVIGANIADNLFSGISPLDRNIKILGRQFRVIGVFQRKGESMFGDSHDNRILIPLNAGRQSIDITDESSNPYIIVKAQDHVSVEELKYELRGIMRASRRINPKQEDNFALNEISLVSNAVKDLFGVVNIAGWIIGLFSIIVGAFGTANIMFVSVKERTNIIGIQKSLGAKNSFILFQFLAEAVILCVIGGAVGLLLILAGTFFLNIIADAGVYLQWNNVLTGLFISVTVGLISGIIPAWLASRLDPVTAIRS